MLTPSIISYTPLGSGLLTGKVKKTDDLTGYAKTRPSNQPGAFEANLKLVNKLEEWAAKKGCTPAQFAINWVASLSKRPGMPVIIPIPGGARVERVQENLKVVELTNEDMDEVDTFLKDFKLTGEWLGGHVKSIMDKTDTAEI